MAFCRNYPATFVTMASEPVDPRIASGTTNVSSQFTEENYKLLQEFSSKFNKLMQTFERYDQAFERYDRSFKLYVAETREYVENSAEKSKNIPTESEKVINQDFEEDTLDISQLFEEMPQKTEICGTVCGIISKLEESSLDVYQVFVEMPKKNSKEDSSKILSANHSEQCISIDFYRDMMFNEDYLHLIVEERCVERHPEMLLPPPEPPDITSLGGKKIINIEDLFTFSIPVVTHASRLPAEFLQPSIVRQLVRVFNFDGVDLCCHKTLRIMQLLDLVYMFDVNTSRETFVDSCNPALESGYITTVVHDCKRDSEALHFQFGFMLHTVVGIQIAYSLIKEQEGNKLYLNYNGGVASISISMVFSSVLWTRLLKKEGSNVTIQEEGVEVIAIKPLIKWDMRSTLFLLNQVTGKDILAVVMTRIEVSLIYFVDFPSLVPRLIKAIVHLLAKRGSALLSARFFVILDVSAMFNPSHFDSCLAKTFVAFVSCSGVTDLVIMKHILLSRGRIAESYSINIQKSSIRAVGSVSAQIWHLVVQTEKNEAVKNVFSQKYVNCIDPCFKNISGDLQLLFSMIIQIIKGVAHIFPLPRYFPIRLKFIEWLNYLPSWSETFILPASLGVDILEYKCFKEGIKAQRAFNFVSALKLLKHYLELQNFKEDCFNSPSEQLALHFARRNYLNCLIEHVEHDVELVQRNKLEKCHGHSLLTLSLSKCENISLLERTNVKRVGTYPFSSLGKMDRVMELLELMSDDKFSYPFDNYVCSSAVSGFVRIGQPEFAVGFYENAYAKKKRAANLDNDADSTVENFNFISLEDKTVKGGSNVVI